MSIIRSLRAGRVLYHSSNPSDENFVLLQSPSPKQWEGLLLTSGSTPRFIHTNAANLAGSYDRFTWRSAIGYSAADHNTITTGIRARLPKAGTWKTSRAIKVDHGAATILDPSAPAFTLLTSAVPPAAGSLASLVSASTIEPMVVHEDLYLKTADEPVVTEEPTSSTKRSTKFDVPIPDKDAYWYESDDDRKLTSDFISLKRAGHIVNLMIAGPSGAGKTVGVLKLADELGVPVHVVNCQAITTPEKWIGQMHADPVKGTHFEPSEHIQWVERTHPDCAGAEYCIILYDEITRLRPELNNTTYSLFDTQMGLEVPQMNRRVNMSPDNLIVSTANIGAAFAGTFGQDRAFRERFAMTLERQFPPMDEEIKIITSYTAGKLSNDDARKMVKVCHETRRQWKKQELDQPISTRTLNVWALLVAGGYSIAQAAEYTVLPLYSEDGDVESDRTKVRLLIDGKAGV